MHSTIRFHLTNTAVFWVSFAIFGLLSSIWAICTPLEASPDEPVHTMRAAAVVRGDIGGRSTETPSPGPPLPNSVDYALEVPESYANLPAAPVCFAFQPDATADCQPELSTSTATTTASISTGSYPPLYYALVGWPSHFLPADPGIYWIRIASALLGSALLASGMVAARKVDRTGFIFIGVALGVTPMTLFMIGVVNPNGLEITSAFAAWLGALELLRAARAGPVSKGTLARVSIPAVALAWSRPAGLLMLAIIGLTVIVFEGDRSAIRRLTADRRVTITAAVAGLAVLGAALWILQAKSFSSFLGIPQPGLTSGEAAQQSIGKLPDRLEDMVGRFGWLDVSLPGAVTWMWGAAILALAAAGLWFARARQRIAITMSGLAVVAMPTAAEALRAPEYGFFWQGRYSLPLAVGIPLLCAIAVGDRLRDREIVQNRRLVVGAVIAGVLVATFGHVLAHVTAMRRYITGADSPLLEYLDVTTWQPPLPSSVLLVVATMAALGYAAWVTVLATTTKGTTSSQHRAEPPASLVGRRDDTTAVSWNR